ncbi:MAG: nucleotide exchange factor GrpE [Jatrophihabitans sp.]
MSDYEQRRTAGEAEETPPVVIRDRRKVDLHGDRPRTPDAPAAAAEPAELAEPAEPDAPAPSQAETELAERTADLQRLQAEYANYRKRVDRDRATSGELATARVLGALVPVLDDVDRAEAHGDLTGAFKAVADQLSAVLGKLGLESFAEVGDPFDPAIHEAVMHDESPDVEVPTATLVMRRGYRVADRLVRPAMVGVSDPAPAESPAAAKPDASDPDED